MCAYDTISPHCPVYAGCMNHVILGVEVAAALSDKASSITIVDRVKAPFQLALGLEVGTALKQVIFVIFINIWRKQA